MPSIRRRLVLKLFLSYLVIILIGMIVLAIAATFVIPAAFNHHMGTMTNNGMMDWDMGNNLFNNFRSAFKEALGWAGFTAFAAAVLASLFLSRQVVAPVKEMMSASQSIAKGHYNQRVGVSGNLDELDQLALSFNQMAETLEQTETMRRQLIGDVSHELRTPLTAIKGSMEGLLDGVLAPTPETFQEIYQEADRLQRLVADLQELSRVEAGALQLTLQPVALSRLVDSIAQRLRQQFEEKGVSLNLNVPPTVPDVLVDEDRIAQVLINLVGNALQYTPSEGQVSVTAQKVTGEIQVSVQDTGIGILPEHIPHLFTRFYRVDKSRSRAAGGSGIGLTIARHLVEAHGGQIWAESDGTGRGSSFNFSLPLVSRYA
jgi:two-component system sensor histidine kinase BaeS